MNWLITGCCFIGTAPVKDLVANGRHFIRIINNLSVGTRENLARVSNFVEKNTNTLAHHISKSPPVELIVGDILDEGLAMKASNGIDIIVHLEASTGIEKSVAEPRSDLVANVIGTLSSTQGGCSAQLFGYCQST
jgi:UDP-glucose 4-epimerase